MSHSQLFFESLSLTLGFLGILRLAGICVSPARWACPYNQTEPYPYRGKLDNNTDGIDVLFNQWALGQFVDGQFIGGRRDSYDDDFDDDFDDEPYGGNYSAMAM